MKKIIIILLSVLFCSSMFADIFQGQEQINIKVINNTTCEMAVHLNMKDSYDWRTFNRQLVSVKPATESKQELNAISDYAIPAGASKILTYNVNYKLSYFPFGYSPIYNNFKVYANGDNAVTDELSKDMAPSTNSFFEFYCRLLKDSNNKSYVKLLSCMDNSSLVYKNISSNLKEINISSFANSDYKAGDILGTITIQQAYDNIRKL